MVTVVTNNHFEPGTYSNLTEGILHKMEERYIGSWWFNSVFKGYNANTDRYEDLTPSECIKLYNTAYMFNHRNVFVITKQSSNTKHNNTLLDMIYIGGLSASPRSWLCSYHLAGDIETYLEGGFPCNPRELTTNVTSGLPWWVKLTTGEVVEISGCKSERTAEKCKVQFSLEIMIVVVCCNFVKAFCMVTAVVRSREPTLVTLGDAIDSFLRSPDQSTIGMCFADRRFIDREWRRGWRTQPRQWKKNGVQRWWTSVSKTRWIICNLSVLIIVIVAGVSLRLGIDQERQYWNTDIKSM